MKKETLTRSDVKFTLVPNKSITLFVKGNQKSYLSDDPLFDQIMKCIKEGAWDLLDKLMNPEALIEKLSKGTFKVVDGVVYVGTDSGTHELPEELNSTVLEFMNEKLPYDYLVKFAVKLFANPSEASIKQLYKYLVKNQFPICEDGDFIAYRKVTDDFKDFRTGTFDNSIGKTPEMRREDVDDDPNVTCSRGLHAANWDYVHNSYYPGQGRIVAMKINPADVVSVPTDYNDAKMRVCKFFVLEEVKAEYTGPRAYKYDGPGQNLDDEGVDESDEDYCCEECNEDDNVEENHDLIVPSHARPYSVSLLEEIISNEDLCNDQDFIDELADMLNESLAFSTGDKTVFVLSTEDYDWFLEFIETEDEAYETSKNHITDMFSFQEGLRLVRAKKACTYPEVLDLRAASRNGTLKVFNKKRFDKEYRDILGLE